MNNIHTLCYKYTHTHQFKKINYLKFNLNLQQISSKHWGKARANLPNFHYMALMMLKEQKVLHVNQRYQLTEMNVNQPLQQNEKLQVLQPLQMVEVIAELEAKDNLIDLMFQKV